ncbi:MAG: hypothetical protein J1F35_03540 [Erysipelotrichales bacterium]|nr:hypothetical protein [Erysipelotrichales bacterium]
MADVIIGQVLDDEIKEELGFDSPSKSSERSNYFDAKTTEAFGGAFSSSFIRTLHTPLDLSSVQPNWEYFQRDLNNAGTSANLYKGMIVSFTYDNAPNIENFNYTAEDGTTYSTYGPNDDITGQTGLYYVYGYFNSNTPGDQGTYLVDKILTQSESGNSIASRLGSYYTGVGEWWQLTRSEDPEDIEIAEKYVAGTLEDDSVLSYGEIFNDYINNVASGKYSHAEGKNTTSLEIGSHTEGENTYAGLANSHAEGYNTYAGYRLNSDGTDFEIITGLAVSSCGAHAEGVKTVASSHGAHAEGELTFALGESSHSEGRNTYALGEYSHAEGLHTYATAINSHSEGSNTHAEKPYTHSEGYHTYASGTGSHVEGMYNHSIGEGSHAEGQWTYAIGESSHAEGYDTYTGLDNSHAEGYHTYAGFIVSSDGTELQTITGLLISSCASHAEGIKTIAGAHGAHAEGRQTNAAGAASHSEGSNTYAIGSNSHSEGLNTYAAAEHSHAEGYNTYAGYRKSPGKNPEIINGDLAGVGGPHAEGVNTIAGPCASHAEGYYTEANGKYSHTEGEYTIASKQAAHAEGSYTNSLGESSHAEGSYTYSIGDSSHSEGGNTYSFGQYTHTEGYGTRVDIDGYASHAEGLYSFATDYASHAEGESTIAQGYASHAEGTITESIGISSHTEGSENIAFGHSSHAEGQYNRVYNDGEHASGIYNLSYKEENKNSEYEPADNDEIIEDTDNSSIDLNSTLFTIGNGCPEIDSTEFAEIYNGVCELNNYEFDSTDLEIPIDIKVGYCNFKADIQEDINFNNITGINIYTEQSQLINLSSNFDKEHSIYYIYTKHSDLENNIPYLYQKSIEENQGIIIKITKEENLLNVDIYYRSDQLEDYENFQLGLTILLSYIPEIKGRHNAFEVRRGGDIYISDTLSDGDYYEKPMIHLQKILKEITNFNNNTVGWYEANDEPDIEEDEPNFIDMGEAGIWSRYPIGVSEWNSDWKNNIKYFQWGDIEGYTRSQIGVDKQFAWSDYKYGNSREDLIKYNSDRLLDLLPEDDACTQIMGENWKIPNAEEFQNLISLCDSEIVTNYNGVLGLNGKIFKLKTNNSKQLFIPFAYSYNNGTIFLDNQEYSNFWSSELNPSIDWYSLTFYFEFGESATSGSMIERYFGCPIIGILKS